MVTDLTDKDLAEIRARHKEKMAELTDMHIPTTTTQRLVTRLLAHLDKQSAEIDDRDVRLHKIRQWAEAYPLDIFPEPDFEKAHEVLTANGMTLDAISASNMRRVLTGVREILDDD